MDLKEKLTKKKANTKEYFFPDKHGKNMQEPDKKYQSQQNFDLKK